MKAARLRPVFNAAGLVPVLMLLLGMLPAAGVQAAERSFPVATFDSVGLSDIEDVEITTGGRVGVVAQGDAAELDRLQVSVRAGVLEVAPRVPGGIAAAPVRARIRITAPMINHLAMRGGGAARINRIEATGFIASLAGSGHIDIAVVESASVTFSTAGSGSISAAGRCHAARATSRGSGSIDIARLDCATLEADTGGSGDISAHASDTAKLTITGTGNINVSGGARCTVSAIGTGKALCR